MRSLLGRLRDRLIGWIDPGGDDEPTGGDDAALLRDMARSGLPVSTPDAKLSVMTGMSFSGARHRPRPDPSTRPRA